MPSAFEVRRLMQADAEGYRALRLEGLRTHPEAFSASFEDEVSKPLSWFTERLQSNFVLGGLRDDATLLGTAGLLIPEARKTKHKGTLWGMFVDPQARGSGMAVALVQGVIQQAQLLVEEVRLTVVTTNTAAIRLYTRAGFRQYGLERRSLRVGEAYYDDLLMSRPFSQSG